MRIIFTLFLFFIATHSFSQPADTAKIIVTGNCWGRKIPDTNSLSKALQGRSVCGFKPVETDTTKTPVGRKMSCQRTINGNSQPPVFIDGVLTEEGSMNYINPADIEKVEVLKLADAMALLGVAGENGAIAITTKNFGKIKFIIRDLSDSSCIPSASVNFSEGMQLSRTSFSTDVKGTLLADRRVITKKNTVTVSAVGYKTYKVTLKYFSSQQEIFMQKDFKVENEVMVTSHRRRRGCPCCWYTKKAGKPVISAVPTPVTVSFFPNPVIRGQFLNIRLKNNKTGNCQLRITAINGMTVLRQDLEVERKGQIFQVPTDSRWAAGLYFIELLYENGELMASGKITIQ